MKSVFRLVIIVAVVLVVSCKKKDEEIKATVIAANGNISSKLNEFKNLIGSTLNTTTGVTGGRREINWDAVPDSMLNKKLPNDFFNPVGSEAVLSRQRGLAYTELGSFSVSKTNFSEINSNAAAEFAAFSGEKVFANTDASLWDIAFEVAGERRAASVKGFGAVFADADAGNTTFMEFFNGDKSLGKYYVPAQNNSSKFSFLGVYFENEKITRIRIGHEGKLNDGQKDVSQGGTHDLIVMDDFIYSEPVGQ
jgi:hypothetical protein